MVFAKPTFIPTIGYDTQRLERGWFSQNQPSAFLYGGWKSVGFGLIFCTKQLTTVGPVREGVKRRVAHYPQHGCIPLAVSLPLHFYFHLSLSEIGTSSPHTRLHLLGIISIIIDNIDKFESSNVSIIKKNVCSLFIPLAQI